MEKRMAKIPNWNRRYSNPAALTPYEQKIWELHQQGKDPATIAKEFGTKHASTISSRMMVIREKLEVANG
jgi:DNA-binding NarL/FixJ family response regulator